MATPMSERCTLVTAFVEFELLPDLLARTPEPEVGATPEPEPGGRPGALEFALSSGEIDEQSAIRQWADVLADAGPNLDHVEEGDLPDDETLDGALAADAWRLAKRLGWFAPGGMTPASVRLAHIAERPWPRRTPQDHRTIVDTVAESVRQRYVGGDGLEVVDLLQDGARSLGQTEHVWAKTCPGLLLVEFEALIHWAFESPSRALELSKELVQYRDIAMHRYGPPPADADPGDLRLVHADATALLYLETEELAARTELTLTEVRSTAMLLTFAELLEAPSPMDHVNFLTPP